MLASKLLVSIEITYNFFIPLDAKKVTITENSDGTRTISL